MEEIGNDYGQGPCQRVQKTAIWSQEKVRISGFLEKKTFCKQEWNGTFCFENCSDLMWEKNWSSEQEKHFLTFPVSKSQ